MLTFVKFVVTASMPIVNNFVGDDKENTHSNVARRASPTRKTGGGFASLLSEASNAIKKERSQSALLHDARVAREMEDKERAEQVTFCPRSVAVWGTIGARSR